MTFLKRIFVAYTFYTILSTTAMANIQKTSAVLLHYNFAQNTQDYPYLQSLYHTRLSEIQDASITNPLTFIFNALYIGDIHSAAAIAQQNPDSRAGVYLALVHNIVTNTWDATLAQSIQNTNDELLLALQYMFATYKEKKQTIKSIAKKAPYIHENLQNVDLKTHASLRQNTAEIFANTKNVNVALLQLAHTLSPKNTDVLYALMARYTDEGADYMIEKILPKLPRNAYTDSFLRHIYRTLETDKTRQSVINHMQPNAPERDLSTAFYFIQQRHYKDALEILRTMNQSEALLGDADYLYDIGRVYERLGDIPNAQKYLRMAVKLSNNNPNAVNYLAYTEIVNGIDTQNNLRKLIQAYDASPTPYIADSLGWAYYKIGDVENALKYMEIAITEMPTNGVINDHLGDIYMTLGRKNEALIHWYRALQDSDDPDISHHTIQQKFDAHK